MNQNDFDRFGEMLGLMAELYGKTMKPAQTAMYFHALESYPLTAIQAAMNAHSRDTERGRFWPLPADLIAQLETMQTRDGRPTPEEAWSTAIQSQDETLTVVWTTETAQAWADVGKALMEAGDRFNASRGFIDLYKRLVDSARKQGVPAQWVVSPGYNQSLRRQAIESAYRNKQITKAQAVAMLPSAPPADDNVLLAITGAVVHRIGLDGLDRIAELQTAGEAHQRGIAMMREALAKQAQGSPKKFNPRECLAVFERAEQAGVFLLPDDKKHWLTVAGAGGDMSGLRARMLNQRGVA